MDLDRRHSVAVALIELAGADGYRDRADASRTLASFVDIPEARQELLSLALDTRDTSSPHQTAQALLRRQDAAGLGIAEALTTTDFQHSSWIHAAVVDVFGVFASDRDAAMQAHLALLPQRNPSTDWSVDHLVRLRAMDSWGSDLDRM
jgi:hypothetical protein